MVNDKLLMVNEMEGWKEVHLKDIYNELIMGQSPSSSTYNDEKKGLPFVQGNADMESGFPKIRIYTTDPKKLSQKCDILLSVRAPVGDLFKNNVGKIAIGRGISAIRISNKSLNKYVFHYFTWDKQQFLKLQQGTTFTEIGKREVRNLKIPLPENPKEQTAIATILSKVDEAIEAVRQSIKTAEKLKKALMQNLLTGKLKPDGPDGYRERTDDEFYEDEKFGKVPVGWEVKKLKDVCNRGGQYGANASAIDFKKGNPRYIRITDIDDYGNLIEENKVGIEANKVKDYLLKENDFLFARTGDTVGKSLLYKNKMGIAAYAGYLIKFTFNINKILPEYFNLIAKSDIFEAFKIAMQRVGAKPNINSREYGSFKFILPNLVDEQVEIYQQAEPLDNAIKQKQTKIQTLQRLKKSLMQNLLTGKVRLPAEFIKKAGVDVEAINKIISEQSNG